MEGEEMTKEQAQELHAKAVEVVNKLNGKTPDEIAEMLRVAGITGERADSYRCPLAKWFKQELPNVNLYVGNSTLILEDARFELFGSWIETEAARYVELPEEAIRFISGFDAGDYGFLNSALVD